MSFFSVFISTLLLLLKCGQRRVAVFILAFAGLLISIEAVANRPVHTRDSRVFSVVGEDARSVGFVRDTATHFEIRADRYFATPSFRSTILLRLLPPDAAVPGQGIKPHIQVSDFGLVTGSVVWDEGTSFESVCRLIAEAYLSQLAFYESGRQGVERLPAWLVFAMQHDLLFALRPTIANVWAQAALLHGGMAIDNLLQEDLSLFEAQASAHDAFWFFRALLERIPERVEREGFFRRLLREEWQLKDWIPLVDPFVMALTQVNTDGGDLVAMTELDKLTLWWSWARGHQVVRHRSFYETILESQQLLQGLIQFEIPNLNLQGRAGLRQLWQRRDESEIIAIVEARITLLASRMERMNPLYFNAAHSLAVLYQILLRESSTTPAFIRALTDFLSDYEDARDLARSISEHL
jgi:hypothetical protein